MKRILLCLLLGTMCFGYTRMSTLTEEAGKINSAESVRQERLLRRKEKLENDLEKLYENYNSRTETTEKLRVDSEVRWYRNEYKKVLNQYDDYYKNINKLIIQKEARIEEITMILSVMD